MATTEQKKAYNSNLKRCFAAIDYIDHKDRTQQEIDKWIPEYKKLLLNQENLMKLCGLKSGDKEVLEGFKI